jgi:hypothetical protein
MSKYVYQIEFNDEKIKINQILTALAEIAREMDLTHRKLMSELKWSSKGSIIPPKFNDDKPIFEMNVPDELTHDIGVSNEALRIQPINDKMIQVAITDASLPPKKCEELAIKFAQQLYKKITGKAIRREHILLNKIASLEVNICEQCLKALEDLPYRCRYCGRTFCYDHRMPEAHGCQLSEKLRLPENSQGGRREIGKCEKNARPEIIVRKIPCG